MLPCYRSLLPKILTESFCGIIITNMMMYDDSSKESSIKRFMEVEGYKGKKNDVLFHPPKTGVPAIGKVFYFGGDVQDYRENMLKHRDNQRHVQWCLEQTATLLHKRFPSHEIYIIKPSQMSLGTFSCYHNFVQSDTTGAPTHSLNTDALRHLKGLATNLDGIKAGVCNSKEDIHTDAHKCGTSQENSKVPLILVGFSKGCAVLNQILYNIHALDTDSDPELIEFYGTFQDMYWLDGGHSGGSNTWVTNKKVLKSFSHTNIGVNIFVTPYQVSCIFRPWIGKEEKKFRETLKQLGVNVQRELSFKEFPGSLEYHFRVLEVFSSQKEPKPLANGSTSNDL